MRRRHLAWFAGALLVLGVGIPASPAGATVLPREPFQGTRSYEYSDCGYPIHVDSTFRGAANIRVGKHGKETAFFLRQTSSFREVHTNTLTGEWFVVRGHSTFREVKATRVEGNVFEFTQVESGQPFVVEDSSGHVVVRDRGSIRTHIVFDTGGDDQPGGEFVEFLGVDVTGPHPGFFTNFCAIAGSLVGISDSSQRVTLHPKGTTASPLGYGEYLPPDYGDSGPSPLLVFLHGSGESGDGSAEQLANLANTAIPSYIAFDGWPDDRPFVVLAPQHEITGDLSPYAACDGVQFGGSCALTLQHELGHPEPGSICFTPHEIATFLSYAIATYDVDPRRVYLTGLSCGGFGAWEYLSTYGDDQVAAVVPIAGEGRPAWATAGCALGAVPIWAFHGLVDDVVNPAGSIEPVTNLQTCPSSPARDARLTTYTDADHDSWTRTYAIGADNDIYSWMLGITHP
jgi:predicted esterase